MSAIYTRSLLQRSVAEPPEPRTAVDYILDGLTPVMIFLMVLPVVYFLLDVRYVFTEVHDQNLRWVAFFFVMGIVALNRLIAWEGMQEGFIYGAILAGTVVLYTVMTTGVYDVGSVARGFLDRTETAVAFNLAVVMFIWWVTHRLARECCLDEDPEAGDIGILTGTLRKMRQTLERKPDETPEADFYDPMEWKKPEPKARLEPLEADRRLPRRHPGISVFYFSVPVMAIFALGLPVLRQGGERMILAGHFYVGLYTVSALTLLMLTSLGGLREYFRARRVHLPGALGPFWLGLGTLMIVVVLFGAAALPKPDLPPFAAIDRHETDFWTRDSTFELSVAAPVAERLQQSRFMERVGQGVLVVLGAFVVFALIRALGTAAAAIARRRHRYPRFVVRLFDGLDRLLQRLTRVPRLPRREPRRRIHRDVAVSAHYRNPLANPEAAERMTIPDLVSNAYEALCALAYDLGVPRRDDQTPYEFIESFPKELDRLREEAVELTDLYVRAHYSREVLDPRTAGRVRKFWRAYERVRSRVVR